MTEQIKIRAATEEDAENILSIQSEVLAEEDYLITTLEEFQQTIGEQKKWVEAKLANERELILIAQYQEKNSWLACVSITKSKTISSYRLLWHDDIKKNIVVWALGNACLSSY